MVEDKVPYFSGDNYKKWREAVLLHLGCIDLDYVLRKEEPTAPTDTSTLVEIALYERICGLIPECENAKDLINAIHAPFETSGKALGSTLMSRLTSIRLIGIKGVREHIVKMRDITAQLRSLQMVINDDFLVHYA
ncbi:uncharacterized protein LOC116108100 [Pistacia vera]|uniref:uncharacterized protein LOC116108100 n=1 Tax=Pistacia vera TaxID=55513 RepID=UPI0012630ED9|nr:uncharacterized protein LOC116108100 [Pistacia vera]